MQSVPQLIPAGVELTVPLPVVVTVRVCSIWVKVAVTVLAASMVVVQVVGVAVMQFVQFVIVQLVSGAAVRVTTVPWAISSLQSVPQLIPAGVELTVPLPVVVTVRVCSIGLNTASTV